MDALAAIARAKEHIAMMFQEENITNIGLEEIEFVDAAEQWAVTIGFERPWDQPPGVAAKLASARQLSRRPRTYKLVTMDDRDGRVLSVRNREPALSY